MSQEGYELFVNLCGIYHILLQIILFLIIWDIFYKSEREKKTLLLMGIFAAVNIFLYISPGVPGGLRYAV